MTGFEGFLLLLVAPFALAFPAVLIAWHLWALGDRRREAEAVSRAAWDAQLRRTQADIDARILSEYEGEFSE